MVQGNKREGIVKSEFVGFFYPRTCPFLLVLLFTASIIFERTFYYLFPCPAWERSALKRRYFNMKLISRIFASFLFLALLLPLTAFYQEETSAQNGTDTCTGIYDVDIPVEGTGKNKAQARDDLDYKISVEASLICSGSCIPAHIGEFEMNNFGTCEAVRIEKTKVNCKERRRDRSWVCTTRIIKVQCACVEEVDH